MDGTRRKYYRFRYCWNYSRNQNPEKIGTYRSLVEVADELLKISGKRGVIYSG